MKSTIAAIMILLGGGALALAAEGGPCAEKREAIQKSHEAFHECMTAWQESLHQDKEDPKDDCQGKLTAMTSAIKDMKACKKTVKEEHEKKRAEHQKKHEEKKAE